MNDDSESYSRGDVHARIREINEILSSGSYEDLDSIKAEVNEIITWYEEMSYRDVDEKREVKKAQSLIIRQQISTN